jgi:hypothetical protein
MPSKATSIGIGTFFDHAKKLNVDAWPELIFIPFAAGHGGRTADASMAAVCTEADLDDPVKECSTAFGVDGRRAPPCGA